MFVTGFAERRLYSPTPNLRFGPRNALRVDYQVDEGERTVYVKGVGQKEGNRLRIGDPSPSPPSPALSIRVRRISFVSGTRSGSPRGKRRDDSSMTKVAILPVPTNSGTIAYRAVAGDRRSEGRTAGEALDALTRQLSDTEPGTLIVVQSGRPDPFFTAEQQRRFMLEGRYRACRSSPLASRRTVSASRVSDPRCSAAVSGFVRP